jgi:signal transduction histidine kinase
MSLSGSKMVAGQPLTIHVNNFLWNSLWFRLLMFLAFLSASYGAYSWRKTQLKLVEDVRNQLASDLHDDVGSQLSGIRLMAELADDASLTPERRSEELKRIASASEDVLDGLRELVWFINPGRDETAGLLKRMQNYADRHLHAIPHTFDVSDTDVLSRLPLAARREFLLIFKEAIRNIVQHSGATLVSMKVDCIENRLFLAIEDNGTGFDPLETSSGYGLKSMLYRVRKINGTLAVQSHAETGTSIRIELNLPRR